MLIKRENALTILYCIMLADGSVDEAELDELEILGQEICPGTYRTIIDNASQRCGGVVSGISDMEERYDILSDLMSKELTEASSDVKADETVPSRLLLWDMYILSFSNGKCEAHEYRMIRRFERLTSIEENICRDMEQAIKAHKAVCDELSFWNASDMPYTQVRPLIDELENRKKDILNGVTELIADELVVKPKTVTVKQDIVDKAVDAAKPTVQKVKEGAGKTFQQVKDSSGRLWKKGKSGLGDAMQKMAVKLKGSDQAEASSAEDKTTSESEDS